MAGMSLFEHVGARIRELRQGFNEQGISQEVLAAKLGEKTNTISRWESGTYKPTLEDLEKLARFFGVSILTFLPDADVPRDERINALLRSARDLEATDLEELRRFAEFRRARHLFAQIRPPKKKR